MQLVKRQIHDTLNNNLYEQRLAAQVVGLGVTKTTLWSLFCEPIL